VPENSLKLVRVLKRSPGLYIAVKIMAENAEKDYSNGVSQGNILIFIRKVALFTALAG